MANLGRGITALADGIIQGTQMKRQRENDTYQREYMDEQRARARRLEEDNLRANQREIQRQDEMRPGELEIQKQQVNNLKLSGENQSAELEGKQRSLSRDKALNEALDAAYAYGTAERGKAIEKSIMPVPVQGPTPGGKGLPDAFKVGNNTYLDRGEAYQRAESMAGNVYSYINGVHADEVKQRFIASGNQAGAEAYGNWLQGAGVQEGVRHFSSAVAMMDAGNDDGALSALRSAFNARGYLEDGTSIDFGNVKRDQQGRIASVDLVFMDRAGKKHDLKNQNMKDIWKLGQHMLSPDKVAERGLAYLDADSKAKAETQSAKAKEQGEQQARAEAAQSAGFQPGTREYQSYTLTGKLPNSDQQPLTATDRKAILEADEGISANRATIGNLQEAQRLSPQANSGPGASTRAAMGNVVPDYLLPDFISSPESSAATAQLENLSTGNALEQLKAVFGAAPTEGERKILLDIQGSVNQPDHVRQSIYKRAQAAAERRLAFNEQRANELRGGTFYRPRSGQQQPAQQQPPMGGDPQAVIQQARDAVARGADPAAVMGRLRELGFDLGE